MTKKTYNWIYTLQICSVWNSKFGMKVSLWTAACCCEGLTTLGSSAAAHTSFLLPGLWWMEEQGAIHWGGGCWARQCHAPWGTKLQGGVSVPRGRVLFSLSQDCNKFVDYLSSVHWTAVNSSDITFLWSLTDVLLCSFSQTENLSIKCSINTQVRHFRDTFHAYPRHLWRAACSNYNHQQSGIMLSSQKA